SASRLGLCQLSVSPSEGFAVWPLPAPDGRALRGAAEAAPLLAHTLNWERPKGDGRGGRGVLNLYLLRHGETEFSRGDRFCGDIDAPLTSVGALMGHKFADAYGDLSWRAII